MDTRLFADVLTVAPVNLGTYGFAPAMVVAVGEQGETGTVWLCRDMLRRRGTIYAALRDDGLPLVVGAAPGRLWRHWRAIIGIVAGEAACHPGPGFDASDPRGWARAVRGRTFQVWARKSLASASHELIDKDAAALTELLRPALGTATGQQRPANLPQPPLEHLVGA